MRANPAFQTNSLEFWSVVRFLSQKIGYTREGQFIIPTPNGINLAFSRAGLDSSRLVSSHGQITPFGQQVIDYFAFRSSLLSSEALPNLMDANQAQALFETERTRINPPPHILPMNKQKGPKRNFAFLTCLVNMHVYAAMGVHHAKIGIHNINFNPMELTSFTHQNFPVRTLSRRVDGAFPGIVNPIAIWEIKEYYYTTTFGSRIADGVYETLLDGYEVQEVRNTFRRDIRHLLFIDARDTWWDMGKSYLCRMVDMLHMRAVSEIVVGCEVVTRVPQLMAEWVAIIH